MTPENRLDRLERIVKLFVKAGLRARLQGREQDERIDLVINHQIRNDRKFAAHEEKFGNHDKEIAFLLNQQIRVDEKFVQVLGMQSRNEIRFGQLADSQTTTEKHLALLVETIRKSGAEQ